MGNYLSGGNGDSPMETARYEYTIVDLHSSHSLSPSSPFRSSRSWVSFLAVCFVLVILASIALVVILSLITLYLPQKGNDIEVDNTSDGIEITVTTTPILISILLRSKVDQRGFCHQFKHQQIGDNN